MACKILDIGGDVMTLQQQEREAVAARDGVAVRNPEMPRQPLPGQFVRRGDRQQFDEEAIELHDMVLRAPRVSIARADLKAGAGIEFRRRAQIAHGVSDVIEAARPRSDMC